MAGTYFSAIPWFMSMAYYSAAASLPEVEPVGMEMRTRMLFFPWLYLSSVFLPLSTPCEEVCLPKTQGFCGKCFDHFWDSPLRSKFRSISDESNGRHPAARPVSELLSESGSYLPYLSAAVTYWEEISKAELSSQDTGALNANEKLCILVE